MKRGAGRQDSYDDGGTPCVSAAIDYLARGWAVMPMEPRGKRPLVVWQALQQRLPARDELRHWFQRHRDANVGIVTGAVSRLVVVDIDPRHGGDASLSALERSHGVLPVTVEAATGGGGRHLYFTHPGGTVRNKVGLAAGIDIRGDGGCVVAPPSVHASGHLYRWVAARGPGDVELAALPAWLMQVVAPPAPPPGRTPRQWRSLLRAGAPQGERNNRVASLAGHLLWHGVDADVVEELLLAWNQSRCRPPLSDVEVRQTVRSIARRASVRHGSGLDA